MAPLRLRYAFRILLKNPLFAAVAILTLALGIGMTTTVFSVIDAVLLRRLSYPAPNRLVWLSLDAPDARTGTREIDRAAAF